MLLLRWTVNQRPSTTEGHEAYKIYSKILLTSVGWPYKKIVFKGNVAQNGYSVQGLVDFARLMCYGEWGAVWVLCRLEPLYCGEIQRKREKKGGERGGGGKDNVFTHKEVFFEFEVVQLSMTCKYPRGKWLCKDPCICTCTVYTRWMHTCIHSWPWKSSTHGLGMQLVYSKYTLVNML
jgi:hypothetical protein